MKALFVVETDRVYLSWGPARHKTPGLPAGQAHVAGRLVLRKHRNDLQFLNIQRNSIPDAAAADPELTAGPLLFEQTDYNLYLCAKGKGRLSILHRDPLITRDISAEGGGRIMHGYVNFGSQVGRSEFTVLIDGKPEFSFEVEVFPAKLDYFTDYREILAEVQEMLTGLALEYLRATFQMGLGFRVPQPTHVEWLSLLRHVMDELERALRYIAAKPVRGLSREPAVVRVEKVKRVDAMVRSVLRRGKGTGAVLELGEGLRVRERVEEYRARTVLDTPEHRWIARQMKLVHQRIRLLRHQEWQRLQEGGGKTERGRQVIRELDRLDERIALLCRLEPLAAAGDTLPPGFVSLQLLAAPGYREAYRAFLLLSLGLRLEGGLIRLSVKELSQLYEYWCYLALLRLISEETGRAIPAHELFSVRQRGLQVLLQKGRTGSVTFEGGSGRRVKVVYNPRFQGDYILIPQQPDMLITLEDPEWPVMHLLLDAKYRVDFSPEYVQKYASPGPPEDALNVLHRYRDAIVENARLSEGGEGPERTIVHAAAVFPYREPSEGDYKKSLLWRSLEKIGIGAVPLLPGEEAYLREWLRKALGRGGEELQVLYRLGRVQELERPIVNKSGTGQGHPFRTHRWTSRLALERARVLEELFLETEPEWRLYEGLRARGVRFHIEPGPVKVPNPENPAGRAWFITENGILARYAGASGFVIKERHGREKYFLKLEEVLQLFEKYAIFSIN